MRHSCTVALRGSPRRSCSAAFLHMLRACMRTLARLLSFAEVGVAHLSCHHCKKAMRLLHLALWGSRWLAMLRRSCFASSHELGLHAFGLCFSSVRMGISMSALIHQWSAGASFQSAETKVFVPGSTRMQSMVDGVHLAADSPSGIRVMAAVAASTANVPGRMLYELGNSDLQAQ